jgi:transcriptional regulator with XRE-family HTH domain
MSGQPESAKRMTTWNVKLGRRIRACRLECGLSQTQLGKRIGVSFQQVQKYEAGANNVSSGRLEQISDLFEVPITFFYDSNGVKRTGHAGVTEAALFDLLQRPDTLRVAKAFNRLPNPNLRRGLVRLIEKLAGVETVSRKKATRKRRRAGADK